MQTRFTHAIRRIKQIPNTTVNHFLGMGYINSVQTQYQEGSEVGEGRNGGNLYFIRKPKGMILAIEYLEDFYGDGILYCFLGSDGKVLPDIEACGEIRCGKSNSDFCRNLLLDV